MVTRRPSDLVFTPHPSCELDHHPHVVACSRCAALLTRGTDLLYVRLNQEQDEEIQRLADDHARVVYERNEGDDVVVGVYGDMQGALKETLVFLGFWRVDSHGVSEQMCDAKVRGRA